MRTRILRDLLPRLSSDAPLLVAAVAGPNNVGKSTLFNTLVASDLSPARAEGGLTQQCLAAATPDTASGAGREALSARYDVVLLPPGARAPVTEPGPPGRLFLTSTATLPPGLVLVDTPDFDSVVRENRLRSEALLVTVDVLVFVVSRHTYQNAALVDVVQQAVGRGRPWVVVYNEAPELETVRAHLDKLAADVGAPPFARYRSPHDPEVEAGRRRLSVEAVDGGPGLGELLGDPERGRGAPHPRTGRRAARCRRPSSGSWRRRCERLASEPERLRTRLRHGLAEVGARAALRGGPRRRAARGLPRRAGRAQPGESVDPPAVSRAGGGAGRGGPQAPFLVQPVRSPRRWRRRRRLPPTRRCAMACGSWSSRSVPSWAPGAATRRTREALAEALGLRTLAALQAPGPLVEDASLREDRAQLLARCRELVRAQLPGGVEEGAIQALATLVYSVPASAAAVVTVATGGIGHDAVVWVGTLLTTPLLERFVDLLGSGRARATWCAPGRSSMAGPSGERSRRGSSARCSSGSIRRSTAAESAAATFSRAAEQLEGGEA